ncbi:MAG TPA: hypothetical protein VNJ51_07615 [Candidatus Dormibacteraeota bacterium]|nr:hypothetical protein [Candidatus Dormibacteraeota bacterium]
MRVGGLIDAHLHLAALDAAIGIPPEQVLRRGVIAAVDAGTFGADDFPAARAVWKATLPVRAFANLVPRGLRGEQPWAAPPDEDPVAPFRDFEADGIKVRLGTAAERDDAADLARAKRAARACRLPLMVHATGARIDPDDLLDALDAGDVLTHCFCTGSFSLIDAAGQVRASAHRARARGVRFDLARGSQHFDRDVARAALGRGFAPDFVSTDATSRTWGAAPVFDLFHVLAEIVSLGMAAEDALAAVTTRPAAFYGFSLPAPTASAFVELDDALRCVRICRDGFTIVERNA